MSLFNAEGSDASLNDKLLAAVEIVQNMPREGPVTTTTDEKLMFYSLYKQATLGPCTVPQPGFWNVVEKFKWNAWKELGNMDTQQAKTTYIDKLVQKIMSANEHNSEWLQHELFDKLLPQFAIMGLRPTSRENAVARVNKTHASGDQEGEQDNSHCDTLSHTSSPFAASDMDYMDCDEDGRQSRELHAVEPFTEERSHSRSRSDSAFRKYCERIENELKIISRQITSLASAAESRHSTLLDILSRTAFRVLIPKKISWKTIIILIIWPFLASMLVRMLRNAIGV
ncbi:unnamed protein product [Cylicocyclus nassatus]|uniref:ACB domain-containing protein n=1 Tax=Cylicocyclus nassatus TaxID=53992 RepID=A0AA36GW96_CYLNA|nr:unnamed protein product [Cylicocyclus nassatus]